MTDKPDSISALARQLGIPDLALKEFVSQYQEMWCQFAKNRGVESSTLESFLSQLKPGPEEFIQPSPANTYAELVNESLPPPLKPSADTVHPDLFFSDVQTVLFGRADQNLNDGNEGFAMDLYALFSPPRAFLRGIRLVKS